ncbi:uncharacterized protein K444DRAFT_612780 [Hyaloscypha bicolor E]|uniref:F-box domain-containing protein n=1 Tax=Hyaloscypha bicolor E TaxID=1095630 RepID=A0A2J6TAU3_9HELO|nr:uncharacterized protein K444DRAFT_612780 [Hyaloscypha bicolor E]PMD60146.1 hypothetical protein K444DRAFT_612780 [Hyaloscypha bicolor E]
MMEAGPSAPSHSSYLPASLLHPLSNSLVLDQIVAYLPVSSLLALGATSKSFKDLVHRTPNVFRHLDLSNVKSAQFDIANIDNGGEVWRNVQLDENVTEDDFYGGPLLYIFNTLRKRHILQDVQTLILDGLSVTSDLISDIITQDHFNVRILSIREVQNLHPRKLQQALRYSVRPSRPAGTPKLKGLYFFGSKDTTPLPRSDRSISCTDTTPSHGVLVHSQGAQIGAQWNQKSGDTLAEEMAHSGDKWYSTGRVLAKSPTTDWDNTILACQGIISFDVVLCHGPRHSLLPSSERSGPWYQKPRYHLTPRVATHSIGGCFNCGRAPEGMSRFGSSPLERFPMLAPPPLHSSTAKAAKAPFMASGGKLLLRCIDCLRNRFCESCNKWWCEDCYEIPEPGQGAGSPHQWGNGGPSIGGHPEKHLKVHMGLCVDNCLVAEMMPGAGSNGMWG